MKLPVKVWPSVLFTKIFWECVWLNLVLLTSIIISLIVVRIAQISMTIPVEGLKPIDLIEIVLIVAPGMLDLAIPVSVALSGCAIAHRLAAEKSMAAIRSLGYSLATPIRSVLAASILIAAVHMFVLNGLRHRANFALQSKMAQVVENNLYELLMPGDIVDLGPAKVSIEHRDGKRMEGVKIFTKEGSGINLISAESATLRLDHGGEGAIFNLKNGVLVTTQPNLEFQATEFSESSIKLPLQLRVMREFKKTSELSNSELIALLRTVSTYYNQELSEHEIESLSEKLQIKHVSTQTIKNKLISLKKELSRRLLGGFFDILLALTGFLLGIYLRPRIPQRYFPIAYSVTILALVFSLFLADLFSEKFTSPNTLLSEGYVFTLFLLGAVAFRATWRLYKEHAKDGISGFFVKLNAD